VSLLVLGVGYTGRAVLALARARGHDARGVVRRAEAAAALRGEGFDVVAVPSFDDALAPFVRDAASVIVTFPPDGATDARARRAIDASGTAPTVAYVSSTSVYGDARGVIDDRTPTAPSAPAGRARLEAEAIWRGATILRAPAIYGTDRGLHVRVLSGKHRIPGDGAGFVSRIHVEDLAALLIATPAAPGETFVVGDLEPAAHIDVVRFVCGAYEVPLPPHAPLETAHETLRGDRRVDGTRALARLGVTLRWPTYRVGMAPRAE